MKVLGSVAAVCLLGLIGVFVVSRFSAATETPKGIGQSDGGREVKSTHGQPDGRPGPTDTVRTTERATRDANGPKWHVRALSAANADVNAPPGGARLDLTEFIRDWPDRISYRLARQYANSDDVRRLHEMLGDKNWEQYWPRVASALGMASDDINSVPVMIDYLRRSDASNQTHGNLGLKVYSLRYLGRIGGSLAKETLTAAMTEDGALALTSRWIDSPLLEKNTGWTRRDILHYIQVASIDGLVFLRDPDVDVMIQRCYEAMVKPTAGDRPDKRLDRPFIMAMASIDLIEEIGVDGYLRLDDNRDLFYPKLDQYVEKYSPCDRALNEQLRKMKSIKRKRPGD